MRIDSHFHFWTPGKYDYPWLASGTGPLYDTFGPEQLAPLLAASKLDGAVLVQTITSLEETRWFLELKRAHPFIKGVVGWVDLESEGVGDLLDELKSAGGLVGIRHPVQDHPDGSWLLKPGTRRGLEALGKRGLAYDLLVKPPQLPATPGLVESLPGVRFVVDHMAKPRIAAKGWDDWAPWMRRLAKSPNVYCKLSGMITEADHRHWKPEDLRPYIQFALDEFGPGRLMFGSDWPVCLLAGSHALALAALEENLSGLPEAQRAEILGGTAAKCYGLA